MRSSTITLFIDTSSSVLYTGIVEDNKLLIEIQEYLGKELSTYTLSKIETMFKNINKQPQDIDQIVVVNGPGSFTGIRIGVTIAKTFAWVLNKQIKMISSLKSMAISTKTENLKIPAIDARREYVFAGIFDSNNEIILKEQYISIQNLLSIASNKKCEYEIISNDQLPMTTTNYKPDILQIVMYAERLESVNPHAVQPIYLKRTEAEETKGITV